MIFLFNYLFFIFQINVTQYQTQNQKVMTNFGPCAKLNTHSFSCFRSHKFTVFDTFHLQNKRTNLHEEAKNDISNNNDKALRKHQ